MKNGEKEHLPRPRVRRISSSGQEASKAGMQWLRGREVPGVEGEGGTGQIPGGLSALVRRQVSFYTQ